MVKFPNVSGAVTVETTVDPGDSFRAGLRVRGAVACARPGISEALTFCNGNAYDVEGALATIYGSDPAFDSAPLFYNAGLPYTSVGQLVVTTSVAAYYVNGVPMSDSNYVCVA